MSQDDYEKMSNEDQVAYWMGRLLIAIGKGEFKGELYMMTDFVRRTAYERGVVAGKTIEAASK